MERLPVELSSEIIKYLDKVSLKALRLVCRCLAQEAAPSLFRHVSMFIQEDSINMLLQIAMRPHLREHVETLRIGLELLPVDTTNGWVGWDHMVDGEVCCGWDHKSKRHINRFIKAQKRLEASGRGLKLLTDAFRGLPFLSCVIVGFPGHPDGSNPKSHGFDQLGLHYQTDPEGFDYLSGNNACRFSDCGNIQLKYLFRAGHAAGLQLDFLDICGANDSCSRSYPHSMHPDFMDLGESDLACARTVLSRTRGFTWIMPDCYDQSVDDIHRLMSLNSCLKRGSSVALLELMPSLDYFKIEPSGVRGESTFDHGLTLKHLLGTKKMPRLRRVKFHFLEFDEDNFVEFLSTQSDTLKDVTFLACGLFTGSMKSLCKRIRARTSLERFRLSTGLHEYRGGVVRLKDFGLWDDNERLYSQWIIERAVTDALEDFVVKRTAKYPTGWVSRVRERGDPEESEEDSEDEFEMPEGPWTYEYHNDTINSAVVKNFNMLYDYVTFSNSELSDSDNSNMSEGSVVSTASLPGLVAAP
ncbi:uncharacterized protein RCO7_03390 [Rhynchosporium graminicola]|uniref:F-box domain-containing protein n=1 Tax=Rhynchosporium graminicola TaxID=2792576 RepID=A0A1E1L790_9HELO|nr:uncharacterized protein RCO7_03390 [Rhynchosporium commune]